MNGLKGPVALVQFLSATYTLMESANKTTNDQVVATTNYFIKLSVCLSFFTLTNKLKGNCLLSGGVIRVTLLVRLLLLETKALHWQRSRLLIFVFIIQDPIMPQLLHI